MFEQVFRKELSLITSDQKLIENFFREIKDKYSESHRHYHNLQHLDFLTKELLPLQETIHDWTVLVISIAFHDFVYNVSKTDNEERSAEFAYGKLTQLQIEEDRKQKCVQQILATRKHVLHTDSDINHFIDADLAILGANPVSYKHYSQQIRAEYGIYPDDVYFAGRKKVLQHFLGMHSIYKTIYFRNRYEGQARENIKAELFDLQ